MPYKANAIIQWVTFGIIAILLTASVVYLLMHSKKTGYVDNEILLRHYEPALQAQAEIERRRNLYLDSIASQKRAVDSLRHALLAAPALVGSQRSQALRTLQSRQNRLSALQLEAHAHAQRVEDEIMQPVIERLNAILAGYGAEHGYYLIWGAANSDHIVYANQYANLTDAILEYMRAHLGADATTARRSAAF